MLQRTEQHCCQIGVPRERERDRVKPEPQHRLADAANAEAWQRWLNAQVTRARYSRLLHAARTQVQGRSAQVPRNSASPCDHMAHLGQDLTNMIASFNELGPGVPASDRVCQALLDVLTTQWQHFSDDGVETPWVHDEEAQNEGELQFKISADFALELSREEHESQNGAWKPMLEARLRRQARPSGPGIAPVLRDAFTPEGLRKVLTVAKMYAKDLKERGLCPKCQGEDKNLRFPSADFCEICCFKVALGIA